MSRRSNHARRGKSPAQPAWLWLLGGVVLGGILAAAAIYSGLAPSPRPAGPQPEPRSATGPASGNGDEAPAVAAGRPRYDFYTVLPEMEVLIPDSELKAQVRAETPAATGTDTPPATVAASGVRYRLQAGSYRDPRPAEEAKARLALLGIGASVQSVNINGATYHRVYVGPFGSAAEVERVKQQLADNGVQAITVREQTP
jgi:cell division protein FtsN